MIAVLAAQGSGTLTAGVPGSLVGDWWSSTKERLPVAHRLASSSAGLDGLPPLPVLRAHRRFGLVRLFACLRACLARSRLDGALAAGEAPSRSPALAYRAARLTSHNCRAGLATQIDNVLIAAARPVDPCSLAAMPDRMEVARARPLLIEVRELLLAPAPIYSQGVAGLVELLRDGGGPIYAPARQGALADELVRLIAALQGR